MTAIELWLVILTVIVFLQALSLGAKQSQIEKFRAIMKAQIAINDDLNRRIVSTAKTMQANIETQKKFVAHVIAQEKVQSTFMDTMSAFAEATNEYFNREIKP